MNKQIKFKHLTGSYKDIPGIPEGDKSIRMRTEQRPQMTDKGSVVFPTLYRDESHVVRVILVSETYEPLSEEHAKLPPVAQDRITQQRTDDYLARIEANKKVRAMIHLFSDQGEIELLGETEIGPDEVLKHKHSIISLSEIAIADHINRGIPIPEELQRAVVNPEIERASKSLSDAETHKETEPKVEKPDNKSAKKN